MSNNPGADYDPDKIQQMFKMHDAVKAKFRQETAQRSEAEVRFDDYLLQQMRKGKKFKVALGKANARFPTEALNPGDQIAGVEAHYQFFLDMEKMDSARRGLERTEQQIKEIDQKIGAILEGMANPPQNPPLNNRPNLKD